MCFPRSRLRFGASGLRHLPHRKPALAPVLRGVQESTNLPHQTGSRREAEPATPCWGNSAQSCLFCLSSQAGCGRPTCNRDQLEPGAPACVPHLSHSTPPLHRRLTVWGEVSNR